MLVLLASLLLEVLTVDLGKSPLVLVSEHTVALVR
jgi:hypothetical protein